jgi:hypothetical protein
MQDRPGVLGWFARHPKTSVSLCFLFVAVLTVFGLDQKANRSLAGRIAALRAKGEPTTVEDLIARQPTIPDNENMTLALAPHGRALSNFKYPDEKDKQLPIIGTTRSPVSGEHLPQAQLDASRWYLEQVKNEIAGIREALKLDRGFMKVNWTKPMMGTLLPELTQLRLICKVLNLEALIMADRGDSDAAADVLVDAFSVSKALNGGEFLICGLVQIAIDASGMDTTERSINLCSFSEPALAKLQAAIRRREAAVNLRAMFEAERVLFLDSIAWVRGGGSLGNLVTPAVPLGPWQYIPVLPALDAGMGLDLYAEFVDAVRKPDTGTINALQAIESRVAALPAYCVMTRIIIPSFSRCAVLWVRSTGQNRSLQAAIAAERHRIATSRWPDSLQELVPRYLDAVPLDPIDGKQIRYAKIPEGIKTWTICDDVNNQDNGGDVRRIEPHTPGKKPMDYGWVILNPDLRGKMTTTQPAKAN